MSVQLLKRPQIVKSKKNCSTIIIRNQFYSRRRDYYKSNKEEVAEKKKIGYNAKKAKAREKKKIERNIVINIK